MGRVQQEETGRWTARVFYCRGSYEALMVDEDGDNGSKFGVSFEDGVTSSLSQGGAARFRKLSVEGVQT